MTEKAKAKTQRTKKPQRFKLYLRDGKTIVGTCNPEQFTNDRIGWWIFVKCVRFSSSLPRLSDFHYLTGVVGIRWIDNDFEQENEGLISASAAFSESIRRKTLDLVGATS